MVNYMYSDGVLILRAWGKLINHTRVTKVYEAQGICHGHFSEIANQYQPKKQVEKDTLVTMAIQSKGRLLAKVKDTVKRG